MRCLCCQLSEPGSPQPSKPGAGFTGRCLHYRPVLSSPEHRLTIPPPLPRGSFSFGGGGSPPEKSLGTLFLDTNVHKLLEEEIKGGVPLSAFQCSIVCGCCSLSLRTSAGGAQGTFVQRCLSWREAHKR